MTKVKRHIPSSMLMAALIHAIAITLLVFGFKLSQTPQGVIQPNIDSVKANLIDPGELRREREAKQRAEERRQQQALEQQRRVEEEKQRLAQLEEEQQQQEKLREEETQRQVEIENARREAELKEQQEIKRQEEEQRAEKKRQEEKRKRDDEAKRKAALEKKKEQEQERKRLEAEQKVEQERLAASIAEEEAEMLAAEESQRQAARQQELKTLTDQYVASIAGKIQKLWRKPANAKTGSQCVVSVIQAPGGYIKDVQVDQCTGDEAFRKSVEDAVWKSDPLPAPSNSDVFDRDLRFTFSPESR